MEDLFPGSYEASRTRFIQEFGLLSSKWPDAQLESYCLENDSTLSIDYGWAEPRQKKNLVIISCGLHGIEGYVGSAMLKVFMDEYAPRFDPENTGLLLVHAINPFGMKFRRRYNENNIDLNRNFVWNEDFKSKENPDYESLAPMLNPARPIENLLLGDANFVSFLVRMILQLGIARIRHGTLSGQYLHPHGVQFGGTSAQESSQVLRGLFQNAIEEYEQVIHIDLHSGYGPRYQMSIVNSSQETATTAELKMRFNYPLILAAIPSDFYSMTGDIGEYFYQLREEKFPSKKLFATCFEFGTFGVSILDQIRSLRVTILENQLFQFGARTPAIRNAVRKEYEELFFPTEIRWREKALADCRQAFEGILGELGLLN